MKIKAIITGASGMVGGGVLQECLLSDKVESVLAVGRSPLGISHPKLKEAITEDFFDLSSIEKDLSGYNACFFCAGVSVYRMSKETYENLTYDLTLSFAGVINKLDPALTFCYVTGAGTDSSEKSRILWARVKGRTENALFKMGFKDAYMFRPGYIQPLKGIKSKIKLYRVFYTFFRPCYYILRLIPNAATNTSNVGRAMISVACFPSDKKILGNKDINKLAKEV